MLKKCLLVGMAVILLVSIGAMASCKGYPETPGDVVKEAHLCMSKMDYEGYKRLFTEDADFPTESEFRELSNLISDSDYESYEVESVDIEGDEAIVTGTVHFAGFTESDTTFLVKQDGQWKIYAEW